jgi:hypothetical protein
MYLAPVVNLGARAVNPVDYASFGGEGTAADVVSMVPSEASCLIAGSGFTISFSVDSSALRASSCSAR